MLRGSFAATIDDKGRLKVPASFRAIIEPKWGSEFFVTSFDGESVRMYPMPVFEELEQQLAGRSTLDPDINLLRTQINFYGQTAAMDGQGRVLIHPRVRERARIDGEVVVLGQQRFLEVWDAHSSEERFKVPLSAQQLRQLAERGF
jgi:MraZ protein